MSYQGRYSQQKSPKEPKKGKGLKIFLTVIGILLTLVVVVGAAGFFYFRSKLNKITVVQYSETVEEETGGRYGYFEEGEEEETTEATEAPTTAPTEPDYGKTGKIINIMLIGQDSREGEDSKLADCLILGSLNKETKTLTLCSFLRDTFLKMPNYKGHECGKNRINVNYALGYSWAGDKGAMEMLDLCIYENFGVEIDGNVEVSFGDFMEVINLMGGITLELDEDEANYMNAIPNINGEFGVGKVSMDGWQALNYVRMRHSSAADNDFKRTERQRKVITEFVKMLSGMNLTELNDLVDAVMPMVKTDIEPSRIMDYILEVAPVLPFLKVESQQIPVEGSAHGEIIDLYGDGMQSAVLIPDVQWNKRVLMKICEDVEIP